jgi:hypothetical protein
MSEPKESGRRQTTGSSAGSEQLIKGIADLAGATLGVGATFARIAAQATAGERPVPPPPQPAAPLTAIVHYSAAALVNVVDAVRAGMGEIRAATGPARSAAPPSPATAAQPAAPAPAAAPANLPTARPDSTLRMPLSIENTSADPMADLQFRCLALEADTTGSGVPLTVANVRFEPDMLTVAPRDFEKLTVYVDVPAGAAPGRYQATIGLESGGFRTSFPFVVAAAAQG